MIEERTAQLQQCMYQYSRAIYRSMKDHIDPYSDRATQLERQMRAEIDRVKRSFRAEIVPYGAYDAGDIVPRSDAQSVQIPVKRPSRRAQREGS